MKIEMRSSVFVHGGAIPSKYTCDGENVSPPILWSSLPPGTATLALIVDDPDAPGKTWVHWVIYNIPSEDRWLPENIPPEKVQPDGCMQGMNDFKRIGYGGPCPPGGTHRYFFRLYALDSRLSLPPGASKDELIKAMDDHVIAHGELIGIYSRNKR